GKRLQNGQNACTTRCESVGCRHMDAPRFPESRMLAFTRRLQLAESVEQLLDELINEVRESVGYQTAWISVLLPERDAFKLLSVSGPGITDIWANAPMIPVGSDAYLQQ